MLASHLLGWRTICAVEWNDYRAGVLVQRQNDGLLPPFPIWDDVRTFDGAPWAGIVDVVSGGFPCQAYSSAASGKNTADDLWPEMRRIVADVAPRYVFAENVQRRAIDRAADELESMGYRTRAIQLSASDLGADHDRKRFWLCAYADSDSELFGTVNAKARMLSAIRPRIWEANPNESRVVDGMAFGLERIKATGDGQVPSVAATAWRILEAHK